MVDQAILARKLEALEGYLTRLGRFQAMSEEDYLADPDRYDLAERLLHLSIECMLDSAQHIIADMSLRSPETNAEVFASLRDGGLIRGEQAERWKRWAGFRKVLVHLYDRIDHRVSYRTLRDELGELREFLAWARALL